METIQDFVNMINANLSFMTGNDNAEVQSFIFGVCQAMSVIGYSVVQQIEMLEEVIEVIDYPDHDHTKIIQKEIESLQEGA